MSRLIDAEKIDFNEVFGGQSDFAKDTRGAAQSLIDAQPTVEAVPKSYAEQIRWERDVAVGQLNEIGCQFGQKMDEVKKKLEVLQWIPCSERMPDTSTQVLVTLGYTYESDYTMYSIARYIHFENGECHWCDNYYGYLEWDKFSDGKGGDSSRRVLAWMPLPEPYKGETENDES